VKVYLLIIFLLLGILDVQAVQSSSGKAEATASQPAPVVDRGLRPTGAKVLLNLPVEKTGPVEIPRFATAPIIDGKLDETIWQTAAVIKDFYQTNPGDNIAPSRDTKVMMGYDSKNIYLALYA
jgi:hypothetical protein